MNTDLRLASAYKQIDSGKVKLLSLDIFDTLVWRKVVIPEDVFLILGEKLKSEGWLIPAVPAEAFPELRIKAERLARLKNSGSGSEVTLQDIYWHLSGIFKKISVEEFIEGKKGIINESDVSDVASIELNLEKSLLRYDENCFNLIKYAASKNIPVILVSNTYFTQNNLKELLQQNLSILPYISKIFPSCEYGVSKGHGLFTKVLEEMKVPPQAILHIGDNFKVDCQGAQECGISFLYYPKYDDELTKIINLEWPTNDLRQRKTLLDTNEGDFGLTSLRAKMFHDITLENYSEKEKFFWKYGASVLGPFLTGFTHWIYDRCKEMNEKEVFCLMREGRLYNNLIKNYAPYYPQHKLKTEELWISRQFITHACIAYGTAAEIYSATKSHPASRFTFDSFCAYLGLDIKKIKPLLKYQHVKLDTQEIALELATFLSEHEELKTQILKTAADKRKRFLNYFTKVVDLRNRSQITLVDAGWSGTIQGALQALLYLSGIPVKVHGLYLGTANGTEGALMQGFIREGYLLKANYPTGAMRVVKRGLYPLEQTGTSDLGILIDITEKGEVITGKSLISKTQARESAIVQQGIFAFCQTLGKFNQNNKWNSNSENLIEQLRHIFVRAAGCPTKKEAKAFGNWFHDHVSIKGTSTHVLGKNKYYEKFIKDMLPENAFEDWGLTWTSGYAANKNEMLAKTALEARLETIPTECFLSIDEIPLRIYVDYGKGFSKKATATLSVKSNANRNFYIYHKLLAFKKSIKKIRLELSCKDSLVHIQSLRFTSSRTDTPESQMSVFFESNKKEKNISTSYPQTQPGTFDCKNQPLILTYPMESPHVYLVHINLCFNTFPNH